MGRKKKFIDKKKSATFQLLARDSSDPNYDTGPSGDRVFIRVDNNPDYSVTSFFEDEREDDGFADDPNSIFADAPCDEDDGSYGPAIGSSLSPRPRTKLPDHVRKEILELGFPDDGYNYLIHLREIKHMGGGSQYYENPKANLRQLPHDVKAYDASKLDISKVNDESTEKSIYSVAAKTVDVRIQKAVDLEVAALLDDSDLSRFGSDSEDLEEDFLVKANIPEVQGQVDVQLDKKLSLLESLENREKTDILDISLSHQNLGKVDGENETINYMDSRGCCFDEKPRVRRLLDEQFDLLELHEYGTEGEDEYDECKYEENNCHESLTEKLNLAFKDRLVDGLELDNKYKAPSDFLHDKKGTEDAELLESASDVIQRCMEYAEKYENDSQDEAVVVIEESSDESDVWDCETVVSTYSNLDNHPGRIEAPRVLSTTNRIISLKGKQKLPVDYLPRNRKSTRERVDAVESFKPEQQMRKQHGQESKEEKKERKAAVKQERRDARRAKKEMKGLYRCEAHNAQKVAAVTGPSAIHFT